MPGPAAGGGEHLELPAALAVVTRSLLPDVEEPEGPTDATTRLGLGRFDAVAVVDHSAGVPHVLSSGCRAVGAALAVEARLGEGPVTTCADTGEAVVCRDVADDPRWPSYRAEAMDGAVVLRRWVAVPLVVPGEGVVASLALAAGAPGIITPTDLATIGILADQAVQGIAAHLGRAGGRRWVPSPDDVRAVARAVARTMEGRGLTEDDALAWLTVQARSAGVRTVDLARHLDDEWR